MATWHVCPQSDGLLGDRLPWVKSDLNGSGDNFTPLTSLTGRSTSMAPPHPSCSRFVATENCRCTSFHGVRRGPHPMPCREKSGRLPLAKNHESVRRNGVLHAEGVVAASAFSANAGVSPG